MICSLHFLVGRSALRTLVPMSTKSTIDNDMLVQSNLEAIASGGEEVVPALKALMRLAMRIRGHWMPRGTLSVPASSSDLAPQVSAELQVHVEEVLLRRLRDTDIKGSEEEQIYVINTLAQWGGAKAADELSERIFTGNQDSKVAGQIFVALGILGGSQSSTALVFGLFFATTKSSDIRWNLMQLMCGGALSLIHI